MNDVLFPDAERVVELAGAEPEPPIPEMTAHGRDRGFPIVGPAVGRVLRLLARLVGARRVFEFGSGFGYSAAWFAPALPEDGEIVLTDFDEENLATAREFLERAGQAGKARFEVGDALDSFERYEGPFDVVLIDHGKSTYVDALDRALPELADGGIVVADNMLAGAVEPAAVRAALEGAKPVDSSVRGVADYIERVRDDPALETALLPVGKGIAVSRRG